MRIRRALTGAALGVSLAVGAVAVPAHAAQPRPAPVSDPMSAKGAAATAPSCVQRIVSHFSWGFTVGLTNKCGKTMRVQVIVDYAPDSPCYVLPNNAYTQYEYEGILGLYDSTAVC
ncbi:beta-Ig-H3/fasciclin [Streptomyces niveus]|uniref:beta-Ig-H3/fasciclin n=1 Tax=Streptomyces niveus TaxID=193462 RepID=UPI0033BFEEE8